MVAGDVALRLPLQSLGRTIFDEDNKHRSVEQDTTTES
jgi:hypothetical protein